MSIDTSKMEFRGVVTEFEGKPVVILELDGEKAGYMSPHHAVGLGIRAIQAGLTAEHMAAIQSFLMEAGTDTGSIGRFLGNMMGHQMTPKVWDYRTLSEGEQPDLVEPK